MTIKLALDMKRIFTPILLACTVFVGALSTAAQDANSRLTVSQAETFVVSLTDQVYRMMDDPATSRTQKTSQLTALINRHVGINFLARLMLSSEHRATATDMQVAQYDDLSRQFVIDLFINRVGQLGERKLTVVDSRISRQGDVIVRTQVRKKDGGLVDVDWRVRANTDGPKIINLSANGVSIVIVKRDEFSSIATKGGFDALLQAMRDSLNLTPSGAGPS